MKVTVITLRSVGFDHVNLEKEREFNIKVANVPSYSPYVVAEHAVTPLMALNRKLILSQQHIQANDFRPDRLIGFDVHGKTVGIIGLEKIGKSFARIMKGFGCKLLCYDPYLNFNFEKALNLKFVETTSLLFLSVCLKVKKKLSADLKHLPKSSGAFFTEYCIFRR